MTFTEFISSYLGAVFIVLILIGLGYFIHKKTEASKILTLRSDLMIMSFIALIMLGLSYFVLDNWAIFRDEDIAWDPQVRYVLMTVLFFVLSLFFLSKSNGFQIIAVAGGSFLLARFLAGNLFLAEFSHYFLWAFALYYTGSTVLYLQKDIITTSIGILLVIIISWFFGWAGKHFFYNTYHLAAYFWCFFIIMILARYIEILEFKRRKRCRSCYGYGRILNAKKPKKFWWAVGYKNIKDSKSCEACNGKGWTYQNDSLLHN